MIHKVNFSEVKFKTFVEFSRKIRDVNDDIWLGTSLYYNGTDYIGSVSIECNSEKTFKKALRIFYEIFSSDS